MVTAGLRHGLAAAHWVTRLIAHELVGVAQSDPMSLGAAVSALVGAAVVACVVPTRLALTADPITAIPSGIMGRSSSLATRQRGVCAPSPLGHDRLGLR
jgi:hypothetical protein